MTISSVGSTLDTAFDLTRRGWHLFPVDHPERPTCVGVGHGSATCAARGKHPAVSWAARATTDSMQITDWFMDTRPYNIGIACGPSGLLVVDEDVPGDLARYASAMNETVPDTFTVSTGHGSHFYFAAPPGVTLGNGTGLLKGYGVDVRGVGGYVVAPGSLHAATGAIYTIRIDVDPVLLPSWLLDALTTSSGGEATSAGGGLADVPDVIADRTRHRTLMKYASSLRARGVPVEEAEVLILSAWQRCEQPPTVKEPYTRREATELLADIYARYEEGHVSPPVTHLSPAEIDDDVEPYAFTPGGSFILDVTTDPEPLWGHGTEVLLADGEALIIAGGQGLGKTTLAQQLALGRCGFPEHADLLGYAITPGAGRVLYLAMDRPRQVARSFRRMVGDAWRAELDDRLVVWKGPPPHDLAKHTSVLLDLCRKAGADTVIVDSLKDAAIPLSDDEVGAGYNRARQRAVTAGVQVIELHHNRKAQGGAAKTVKTIDDLYGSTWITSGVGSVVLLGGSPGDSVVTLHHIKQPADEVGPLRVLHDHEAGRSTVHHAVDLLVLAARPISAVDAARAMFEVIAPDANQKAKARRRLDSLVRAGSLKVTQIGDARSNSPTLWAVI